MLWRGRDSFEEVLARAGYGTGLAELGRLSEAIGEHMERPPTAASLRTACLSRGGRGYKKQATVEAMCRALGCEVRDLYDEPRPARLSTWERMREGVDVEARGRWPT